MASLKDIRTRIDSVSTTKQVTSAMKMVSAAKLKSAELSIERFRPYATKLANIILNIISDIEGEFEIKVAHERPVSNVLIIAVSGNRGLCGAFNSNVIKQVKTVIEDNFSDIKSNVDILSIGKQGEKQLKSAGLNVVGNINELFDDLSFKSVRKITNKLIDDFVSEKYDKIVIVYNKYINAAVQKVTAEVILPFELPKVNANTNKSNYLYESNKIELIKELIPRSLTTVFYKTILESLAAEHGARMTSMHKATDNASDLIDELKLSFNKARQSAITNEILEIVSGAEALAK